MTDEGLKRPETFAVVGDFAEVRGWAARNRINCRMIRVISDASLHGHPGPLVLIELPGSHRLGAPMLERIRNQVARTNAVAYTKPGAIGTRAGATSETLEASHRGDDLIAALVTDLDQLRRLAPEDRVRVLSDWVSNDGGDRAIRSRVYRIRALAALEASETSKEKGETRVDLAARVNLGISRLAELIAMGKEQVSA